MESLLRLNLDKTAFTATLSQENGKSSTATLRFYPVDIEVLFSASPFMKGSEQSKRFSYIAPTKQISVSFAAASNQTAEPSGGASEAALVPEVVVPLPPELRNTNCFVEAEYDGKTQHQTLFSNTLHVTIYQHTGRLFVRHAVSQMPLPRVYVKVYSRPSSSAGKGTFVKDGFTDLRGCFDYASVNKESSANSETSNTTFSILILSNEFGSDVQEVAAPANH